MPASWSSAIARQHQLRAQLGVVAIGVAVYRGELGLLRRHQQLEEKLAIVLVQPVREAPQPLGLTLFISASPSGL